MKGQVPTEYIMSLQSVCRSKQLNDWHETTVSYTISMPTVSKHHSCPNTVTELSPSCQQSLIASLLLSRPDNLGSAVPCHSHQSDVKSVHAGLFAFFISRQVDLFFRMCK